VEDVVCRPKDAGPPQGTDREDWRNTSGLTGHNDVRRYANTESPGNYNGHKGAPSQRAGLMIQGEAQMTKP
jgi:hypothetical protein